MLIFPLLDDQSRKIIHIDMDAFFAAVEERDNPALRGKPVVIARDPRVTGGRGVVSTANYEARRFGIHSAMSAKEAYERCPQAIFIQGDYAKYKAIGLEVREIFRRYTDLIEPMSIDEAYLDVTENKIGSQSAVKVARLIQEDIWRELQLTCSAGISYNKFLAKLASDFQKPRGLTVIKPGEALDFLAPLPIEKFHGVGKKSAERLRQMGVETGADLLEVSEIELIDRFGRFGYDLYRRARGIHNAPVKPNRIRKSFGKEKTYGKFLRQEADVRKELQGLAQQLATNLEREDVQGKTVVLKIRWEDFQTLTKRVSLDRSVFQEADLLEQALALYESIEEKDKAIRLLGITLTNLGKEREEDLLDNPEEKETADHEAL
ncbi:DNA polymerase IV [Streptococcus sp. 121]|uniref:DNA polymerase IV n=1 Tax=Streptococcus sp. 121 TaxID=2797637 RepID=UPI0018F0C003|nr:DNA polymerase IV [Streptococcus sp. 121]MBJ6746407.1 DNA polymerase IV [Streptococcus sp. 121]